ncbi:MAG: transcription antitermination factor NusB [Flavobacteriales bacterium]|jgi:N utilization substance protein B|tara:strand:- start:5631 stop:6596 length:966 start_codon:yes stop_codon:yes gene_type:complete
MLNRRQLRIKAMEVIYAFDKSIDKDINHQLNYFLISNKNFYKLYISYFALFNQIYLYASELHLKNNKKFLKNNSELSLKKISNNYILKKISSDHSLLDQIKKLKINYWVDYPEQMNFVWKSIKESDLMINYSDDSKNTFEEDKSFFVNLFKKIIAPNPKLYEFYEDTEISWVNDYPLINTLVLNSLKKIKQRSRVSLISTKLYKNDEDAEFGIELIKSVITNKEMLQDEISKITPNWDNERIAQIDLILLQMCLSEFLFFKSIPLKVSINEYLEIAKEYSSNKSNIFINGIMDSLSKQFEKDGRINKNKRGLQLFTIFDHI